MPLPDISGVKKYQDEDIKLAQQVEELYGIPASITLAQYGLESAYGTKTVGKNNYFNIKGDGTGGYADYDSKRESFLAYGKLLTNEHYSSYLSDADSIEDFIYGIRDSGYAEDKNYAVKLLNMITSNDLTQYDSGSITYKPEDREYYDEWREGVKEAHSTKLTWWGDIVIVVFTIIIIIIGVVFVGLAVVDNAPSNPLNKVKKVVEKLE